MPARCRRLHHVPEFSHLAASVAGTGISRFRAEKISSVITPIIRETLFGEMLIGQKGVYGHQFHCRYAKPLQVLDYRL